MTLFRRLRGIVAMAGTWGGAFAAINIGILGIFWATSRIPPTDFRALGRAVVGIGLRGMVLGGAAGVLFASTVMLAERRRTLVSLSARRFALWGLTAGATLPLLILTAYRIGGYHWFHVTVGQALFLSGLFGATGAGVAALSLRLARQASRGGNVLGRGDPAPLISTGALGAESSGSGIMNS